MSLRIRFRFDGRCSLHPRYNPEREGRPQSKDCPGCESLYLIHLYTRIARRKAECGDGILVVRNAEIQPDELLPTPDTQDATAPEAKLEMGSRKSGDEA